MRAERNAQLAGRWLAAGAAGCCAVAAALLVVHRHFFEAVVATVAAMLSTDGVVEETNRRALALALLFAAAVALAAGALLAALAVPAWRAAVNAVVTWDPLREAGVGTPNAYRVQGWSLALGALVIGMHLAGRRVGGVLAPLFQKEGPFELLTAGLFLVGAVWCAVAAKHSRMCAPVFSWAVRALYAALAAMLFLVGMEELNWGQTLLGFETPKTWAAINYQQQTSLHNLVPASTLELTERVLLVGFGIGCFSLMALALRWPRAWFAAIAPPASLATLILLCAGPGVYLRLEVTELLLAMFFAFYAFRLYDSTRRPTSAPSPTP
jgi:hypothetical protein